MKPTQFYSPASLLICSLLATTVVHAAPVRDVINKSGLLSQVRLSWDSVAAGTGKSDITDVQWLHRPSKPSELVDGEGDETDRTTQPENPRFREHVHSDNTHDESSEPDTLSNDDPRTLTPARTTYGPMNMIYSLDIESLIIWISTRPVWAWSVVITLLVLLFVVSVVVVEVTSAVCRALKPVTSKAPFEGQEEGIGLVGREKRPPVGADRGKDERRGDGYDAWEVRIEGNKHSVLE